MTTSSGSHPDRPAGGGTPYVQTFRSRFSRVLGGAGMVGSAACLVSVVVGGGERGILRYAGVVLLVGLVSWVAFWRPFVRVDDRGVEVRNPFSDLRVPWHALRDVDGRYGLRLVTTDDRQHDVWAAPSPTGMQRARSQESEAAQMLRGRWERSRALGTAGTVADGSEAGHFRRDVAAVAAVVVVAVLAVVGPLTTL